MLSWTTTRELEDEEKSGDLSASSSQHRRWKTKNSFTRYLHRRTYIAPRNDNEHTGREEKGREHLCLLDIKSAVD